MTGIMKMHFTSEVIHEICFRYVCCDENQFLAMASGQSTKKLDPPKLSHFTIEETESQREVMWLIARLVY